MCGFVPVCRWYIFRLFHIFYFQWRANSPTQVTYHLLDECDRVSFRIALLKHQRCKHWNASDQIQVHVLLARLSRSAVCTSRRKVCRSIAYRMVESSLLYGILNYILCTSAENFYCHLIELPSARGDSGPRGSSDQYFQIERLNLITPWHWSIDINLVGRCCIFGRWPAIGLSEKMPLTWSVAQNTFFVTSSHLAEENILTGMKLPWSIDRSNSGNIRISAQRILLVQTHLSLQYLLHAPIFFFGWFQFILFSMSMDVDSFKVLYNLTHPN